MSGQTVTIYASASDPDGDRLTYSWFADPGPCGPAPNPGAAIASSTNPSPFTLALPAAPDGRLCIWVTVTDPSGASRTDHAEIAVANPPPTAVIDVQQPSTTNGFGRYDLYSMFRLSSARSTDPAGLPITTRTWSLGPAPPTVPVGALNPCPTGTDDVVECLNVGAVAGDYVVTLIVGDGMATSAPTQVTLTVDPDHPPCIAGTMPPPDASPIVLAPGEDETLTVDSVIDDGSPYPGPGNTPTIFAWSLSVDGGAWQDLADYGEHALTVPGEGYVSGQRVDVRVTVSDGLSTHALATCDPACGLGCIEDVVWTLEYR